MPVSAFIALPTHRAELGAAERTRREKIKPLLMESPDGQPRMRDLAQGTGIAATGVRAGLCALARAGEVRRVALDHVFLTKAVARMGDVAAEPAQTDGAARAAAVRERTGGGRKVAIQILEFFDRVGFLRRVRDDHLLRRGNPWRGAEARVAYSPRGYPLAARRGLGMCLAQPPCVAANCVRRSRKETAPMAVFPARFVASSAAP